MNALTKRQQTSTDPLRDKLNSMVRESLSRNGNDAQRATAALFRAVKGDADVYAHMADPLVREACFSLIGRRIRRERSTVWNMPQPSAEEATKRVRSLATGSLLMFALPGGKRLKDGTKVDVLEGADFYQKQAGDMERKAVWLFAIADKLPPGKKVGQVFNDAALRAMQEEVSHAA